MDTTSLNTDLPLFLSTQWPWSQSKRQPEFQTGVNWPKISVITPSYNQGKFIEQAIRSVLLQGYPNLEYIILDAESTDETKHILEIYRPYLSRLIIEKDQGQSDAINKGFVIATGDILCWVNSDDLLLPGALFQVAEAFQSTTECKWAAGNCIHTDTDLKPLWHYRVPSEIPIDYLKFWESNFLAQPSVFFSKDLWKEKGGCKLDLHYAMDLDLWLRFLEVGPPKVIHEDLSINRVYADTKTSTGKEKAIIEITGIVLNSTLNQTANLKEKYIEMALRKYFLNQELDKLRSAVYSVFNSTFSYKLPFAHIVKMAGIFFKNLFLFSIKKRQP